MPVYNGGTLLRPAINSILNQSFADFEFLIIDDGSTDGSLEVATSFADPRIRIESNGRNLGLITTLNRGLDLARGNYIARMDADDIAFPSRLSRQLDFMEARSDVGLCGTWYEWESEQGKAIMKPPADDRLIRFFLIFDTVFAHSTILFRRKFLDDHHLRYDPEYRHAEDFELWTRCSRLTRLANVPEVLLRYHYHADNTSNRHRKEQVRTADRVRCRYLLDLGLIPTDEECHIHTDLIQFRFYGDTKDLEGAAAWLLRLTEAACKTLDLPEQFVLKELSRYWYGACGALADQGPSVYRLFRSHPCAKHAKLGYHAKLQARCMLRKPIPTPTCNRPSVPTSVRKES